MNPQGSSPNLQGGNINLQGSTPKIQGGASAQQLQATAKPTNAGSIAQPLSSGQQIDNNFNQYMSQQNAQIANTQNFLKQIQAQMQAQAPGVAPTLNLNAIRASAAKAANSQVNPLYTQQLNQYLQNEAASQAEQQQQNKMNIAGYQSGLQNTLAQNSQAQQFAGQQNQMQQGNINAQASNYQLQSGMAENQKLSALQAAQGSGNLAGSGMGAQQLWNAENQKNVEDAQQQGQFQYNRDVANMATSNTFAELAQSSKFAQTQEGQQEGASNFSLNSYLRQSAHQQQQYQQALEAWKQQALASAQQNSIAGNVSSQLQKYIGNPKTYQAGVSAYGQQLQTASMPGTVNQGSYQA